MTQPQAQKTQISDERKALYYMGMALVVCGMLTFFSSFFVAANDPFPSKPTPPVQVVPSNEPELVERNREILGIPRTRSTSSSNGMPPFFAVALTGMGMIIVGSILMSLGAQGAAGSGLVLDPHQAREDLKPWSQAAGGMLDDALAQSETIQKVVQPSQREIVKVRCAKCRTLNDEDARFCDACGNQL